MKFQRTVNEVRLALAALGLDVTCPVSESNINNAIAVCEFDTVGRLSITVKRGLRGRALWRVLLHEYGHALGLGHVRSGIMFYKRSTPTDFDNSEPTTAQKKRWALEIARAVLEHRARNWGKAA